MLFLGKPSVTEKELPFLWHMAYIWFTSIRKYHRTKTFCSVTVRVHRHFLFHHVGNKIVWHYLHKHKVCTSSSSVFVSYPSPCTAACLFTRLDSLAWCQQRSSCRNCRFMKPLLLKGNKGWACLEEGESVDKSILHPSKLLSTFPFLQTSNAEKPHPSVPITTKAS